MQPTVNWRRLVILATGMAAATANAQGTSSKPSKSQSTRQTEAARRRLQSDWNRTAKTTDNAEPRTITLNAVPLDERQTPKPNTTTKPPRLANGKSLDDLNLTEGQVVVLDDKGNIVESYIEGKDGKKTPFDPAKLMKKAGAAGKQNIDAERPNRKFVTTEPTKPNLQEPKPAPRKPGFFGRLFGKGKNKDTSSEAAFETEKMETEPTRVGNQIRRPVLR